MAGTLNFGFNLSAVIDSINKQPFQFPGLSIPMAGSDSINRSETLSTTETTADLGDVATPGVMWIKNDGAVNVYVGCQAGQYTITVKPGECWPFRVYGSAVYWKCASSTCRIEYCVYSN